MNIAAIANPSSATVQTDLLTNAERARAAHLHGAALRNASPAEKRAAVGAQFEAIFVRQMLGKTMTSRLGSGSGSGSGESGGGAAGVYGDMLTDTLAQQLTAGRGLGIGRMIEKQLAPRGVPAAPAGVPTACATQAHP